MQKLPNDMNYQGLNFFVRPKAAHIEPYLWDSGRRNARCLNDVNVNVNINGCGNGNGFKEVGGGRLSQLGDLE